jgi:hypothetical protein
MKRSLLPCAMLLIGCESESAPLSSAAPWVPEEALTREHPIASMLPPPPSATAPRPPGFLTLESKSLGWPAGTKLELGVAFAHLLEEWPTPRGGLPRMVVDRIELYAAGVTGVGCASSGEKASPMPSSKPSGGAPTAIVLQGKHRVEVEWEKDFAMGDDFELCVLGAATSKPGASLTCPGLHLGRANVILSLSRDLVGGRLNASSEIASVTGRFNAVVCPLPPLE